MDALQGSSLQPLPTTDVRIGAYSYDAAERARGVHEVYARLEATYTVSLMGEGRPPPPGLVHGLAPVLCCTAFALPAHTLPLPPQPPR